MTQMYTQIIYYQFIQLSKSSVIGFFCSTCNWLRAVPIVTNNDGCSVVRYLAVVAGLHCYSLITLIWSVRESYLHVSSLMTLIIHA